MFLGITCTILLKETFRLDPSGFLITFFLDSFKTFNSRCFFKRSCSSLAASFASCLSIRIQLIQTNDMLETNCRECQRERVMFSFTPLSTLKTESCFFNVAHASQEGGVGEAALTRSFALRPFCLKKNQATICLKA